MEELKILKMQLSNRFNDIDKQRVWLWHNYCAICNSNIGVAGHHIYGSKGTYNNSICNCIFLCLECHNFADTHNIHNTGNEIQINYLRIALRQVVKSGHQFTDLDKNFLQSIKEDVDKVLH